MNQLNWLKKKNWKLPSKAVLYTIMILWIAAGVQMLVNYFYISDKRVLEAFSGTKSVLEESRLEIAADLSNRYLSEEDKKQMIQYIAGEIGLSEPYSLEAQKSDTAQSLQVQKTDENMEAVIDLVTTNKARQYITIKILLHGSERKILTYKNIAERIMKELKAEEKQLLVTLTGTYEGKLTKKEMETESDKIIEQLQAKVVTKMEDTMYTIYAYTGLVKEYIEVAGQPVNLNIAMSYDETRDETILYLATPILNEDF